MVRFFARMVKLYYTDEIAYIRAAIGVITNNNSCFFRNHANIDRLMGRNVSTQQKSFKRYSFQYGYAVLPR